MENGCVLFIIKFVKDIVYFKVIDIGIGIFIDKKDSIFGDFFCVNESKEYGIGFGLGVVWCLSL